MDNGFLETEKNGLVFYTIPSFTATGLVTHGFTTRNGGCSEFPYASLNTALHVGDLDDRVLANRTKACRALGMNPADLVTCQQVHGDAVHIVTETDTGRGAVEFAAAIPDTDALATNVAGIPIACCYADCAPIFLLDPVKRVVAVAHAGWKGTAAKIGLKTVRKMTEQYDTIPSDCLAGIGPSIGPCCYEVDESVAENFREGFSETNVLTQALQPGKWRLDVRQANLAALLEAGLRIENISLAGICTSCKNDEFFSYRAENEVTGRMSSLIMLK